MLKIQNLCIALFLGLLFSCSPKHVYVYYLNDGLSDKKIEKQLNDMQIAYDLYTIKKSVAKFVNNDFEFSTFNSPFLFLQ